MTMIRADQVTIGNRLRSRDGTELTVTRIDEDFLGSGMLAFVEDSDQQWFKMPAAADHEVELLEADSAEN
jgi:hypothetical protein